MADSSRKTDLENLISYCDDLSRVLKDRKDMNNLAYCLQQSQALQSSCDTHSSEVQSFLQDYQRKIDECKEKTEAAISKVVVDVELDQLERELHEELAKERLLMENMR
ncbi:hypothetical protein SAY87_022516 [Trapa incisa]|uniref:Uncharacterized protein n=1 Tax=Trapa incisa TaxID=236973 RepID=A0AAN7KAB7_9MYRT|nr:hypothetical protein SAY87_022516 [Trapa incisa]